MKFHKIIVHAVVLTALLPSFTQAKERRSSSRKHHEPTEKERVAQRDQAEKLAAKQELWVKNLNKTVVGEDGKPLHPVIKEAHTALTLLGVPSVGGRMDGDYPALYVYCENEAQEEIRKQIDEVVKQREQLEALYPDLANSRTGNRPEEKEYLLINNELTRLCDEFEKEGLRLQSKLYALLIKFYASHSSAYDQMLALAYGEVRSVGARRQPIRSEELKDQKVGEYQSEMRAFSAFLKNEFFSS